MGEAGMALQSIAREQRYNRDRPCPICAGWDSQPRGVGHRCHGFVSPEGAFARCAREEYAGGLPIEQSSGCYVHRLAGDCGCGVQHHPSAISAPRNHWRGRDTKRTSLGVTRYELRDADGVLIAYHPREDFADGDKSCWYELPGGRKGLDGLRTETLPLFGTERLRDHPGEEVIIAEGEKAAAALQAAGALALGTATGANGTPADTALAVLRGHPVILWPDNDDVGRSHMARVAAALDRLRIPYRLLAWPGAREKEDAADFLAREGADALPALLASATAPAPTPHVSAPPFPVDALPPVVRALVEAGAAALDVDPAFVAVPLLGFAAGCIGKRYCVEVKQGYRQWPILYVAIVGPPGSGKTPALTLAREPLDRLQQEAWRRYQEEATAYRRDLSDWERRRKDGSATEDDKPTAPTLAHFYTTDATIESLSVSLMTSPGLAYIRDELVAWVRACDQYRSGKGTDRQKWLGAWSKEAWKIDRKKAEPVYVPHPAISVIGGVQPEILPELAHEAGASDGFIDRILWSYPPEHYPDDTDATVGEATMVAACRVFAALRPEWQTEPTEESIAIALDPDARSLYRSWHRDNTRLLREASGLVQGLYAKLPNQAARLALVLHCLAHPDDCGRRRIGAATMGAALELVEYFRAHAYRVLPRFGVTGAGDTGSVVGKVAAILDGAGGEWVGRAAIRDRLHRNCPAASVSEALQRLAELGRAESRVNREGIGRPAEEWRSLTDAGTRERGNAESADGREIERWES